ncbi:RagB/SusD family nutrient uptake outer membrane protein [Pedobacter nyackensis]|uniref:Starch-binding associating with outer membrane n=1 Tax=Pedobacter nyackensis TaxID=475255 RepID=A0A1W2CPW9_9SPHI|nr:RagB/SusD family nutrient uptake outer membrane protein [Pedobacter nyackensis]SMC87280.1 Starch-binding associating with outer membrane [Pedobacter nyackensis]
MKVIKKNIAAVILLICMVLPLGCKKYLNLTPLTELTGNNFYKSKGDVEANISSIYLKFFEKINESWVIGATGESRSGEAFAISTHEFYPSRRVVEVLGNNDLMTVITGAGSGSAWSGFKFSLITNWKGYYQAIQGCNILISKLKEGVPNLSENEKKRYIAEATFIRCFTYFWMVRLYGDVVYYTNPYQSEPLPRENMVAVMKACIADMKEHVNDLPWTFQDPALRGLRASKGGALALMMHMNMWNAGFDDAAANAYYEETVKCGQELLSQNGNAYSLLPLERWPEVIKGRSEESLFEFYQSINYSDKINYLAPFGESFLGYPYKFPAAKYQTSLMAFRGAYMEKLFPRDLADKRKDLWYVDIYANNGRFMMPKFAGNIYASGNEDQLADNSFLIFRLSDAILLHAEALAELGRDPEAINSVNLVRARASAIPYDIGQGPLKDFIFLERCRELQGEGHAWFDLVRTKRILSQRWANHPLTLDQFNRGAWTWPIDSEALKDNPLMTLNDYWTNTVGI